MTPGPRLPDIRDLDHTGRDWQATWHSVAAAVVIAVGCALVVLVGAGLWVGELARGLAATTARIVGVALATALLAFVAVLARREGRGMGAIAAVCAPVIAYLAAVIIGVVTGVD